MTRLSPEFAAQCMRSTLGHLGREYPHKLDHVMTGPADVRSPAALHPIFHGSYDWHSCLHGWWQVLRLARLFPDLSESAAVVARARVVLTPDNFAVERAYIARPSAAGFERPYGWAWALALDTELSLRVDDLATVATGFAQDFAARFRRFLPLQTYPVRVGTHYNSAFALTLAHDWAQAHDPSLVYAIRDAAQRWFAADRGCQAWEPGGDEFLSPALCEAVLMSRLCHPVAFTHWFDAFLPMLAEGVPASLLTPAEVSDRSDGKIAHLDGLNLSRGWCWHRIADALPADHPVVRVARDAADRHIAQALPHLADDYMGEHWLASFALLALETAPA